MRPEEDYLKKHGRTPRQSAKVVSKAVGEIIRLNKLDQERGPKIELIEQVSKKYKINSAHIIAVGGCKL